MNTYTIYGLIVIAVLIVGVILYKHPAFLKKLFSKETEQAIENVAKVADEGLTEAQKILPNNAIVNALAELRNWAIVSAKYSEQEFKKGNINANQRYSNAEGLMTNIATQLGIELTEQNKMFIESSIESAVNSLPHAPEDIKALKDELEKVKIDLQNSANNTSQLEADKTAVLSQLEELKKQKDDAIAQLNAIKGAVKGIQDTTPVETTITNATSNSSVSINDNGVTVSANNISLNGQPLQQ